MRSFFGETPAALALFLGLSLTLPASLARAEALEPAVVETLRSEAATELVRQVLQSGDNGGLPFLVIDKVTAEVLVFDAEGQVRGATFALLGLARGDDSVPGIGDRDLAAILPEERTTPAGRFLAGFGPAADRDDEFWIDYATAVSLHPVATGNPKERRLQRLRTPSASDNRITYGCINVARAFYEEVIRATFKGTRGVAYILPETRPVAEVFPTLAARGWPASSGADGFR